MGTFDTNVSNLEDYDRALQVRFQRATAVQSSSIARADLNFGCRYVVCFSIFEPEPLMAFKRAAPREHDEMVTNSGSAAA